MEFRLLLSIAPKRKPSSRSWPRIARIVCANCSSKRLVDSLTTFFQSISPQGLTLKQTERPCSCIAWVLAKPLDELRCILSTIHANSAQQGLARFTSCVLQSGIDLPYRAVKTNIADSLNVVVHVERRPGRRYISEVLFINGYDPDADLFDYGSVFLAKQEQP